MIWWCCPSITRASVTKKHFKWSKAKNFFQIILLRRVINAKRSISYIQLILMRMKLLNSFRTSFFIFNFFKTNLFFFLNIEANLLFFRIIKTNILYLRNFLILKDLDLWLLVWFIIFNILLYSHGLHDLSNSLYSFFHRS